MKPSNFKSKLLIAIVFFVAILAAVFFGFMSLTKYSSQSFVLSKSIENITVHSKNSLKTQTLLSENQARIDSLSSHTISRQDQIPSVVELIESYADSLKLPIKINNINFIDASKGGPKKLVIDITTNGSFSDLIKILKIFENSDYNISIDRYSIKQALVTQGGHGSSPSFVDVPSSTDSQTSSNANQIKTWVLSARLSIVSSIK
jgi:uncharacterized protein involved in exopolysaccharide biosynthesis